MLSPILKLGLPSSVFPDHTNPLSFAVWVTLDVVNRNHVRWKYLQYNTHELRTDKASGSLPLQGAWEQVSYACAVAFVTRLLKPP